MGQDAGVEWVEPRPTSFPLGAQSAPVLTKSLEEQEVLSPWPCAASIELVRWRAINGQAVLRG